MAKALEPLFLVNNNITEFAKEDFCTAVLEKLLNGSPKGGAIGLLPCLEEVKPDPGAYDKYRNLCDPKAFPDFHDLDDGIMGTYQKMLRSLNTDVTVPGLLQKGLPIFDPTAVAPLFDIEPPKLDELPTFEEITLAFPNPPALLDLIGITLADFALKVPELISVEPPKIPIPEIPSPKLFELGFDFVPPGIPNLIDTGLVNFQLRSFTTPIKALIGLLPKIQNIALQGFLPSAFGDALCGAIKSGFPIKADRPIEAAAHTVMIERSVTAVATAAVAQQLGAGGTIAKTVFEITGGPTQDRVKERLEGLKKEDEAQERNDIPKNRGIIPKKWQKVGKGLNSETYLKIKEIGTTFVNAEFGLDGKKLDDNYKGLIILCLLNHESGIDPGAATVTATGKGSLGLGNEYPTKGGVIAFTDTQVWGMQIVNTVENSQIIYGTGKGPTSMTKKQFRNSPVWNPAIPKIAGMPIGQQLEYYQQYYARLFTAVMNQNDKLKQQSKNSAVGNFPYTGLDPKFVQSIVDKYKNKSIKDGNPYLIQIGNTVPGPRSTKDGNIRPYPLQNVYDLYGFHQGFKGGETNGYGSWLGSQKRIPYTMASRTVQMLFKKEHVQRYVEVTGMDTSQGINWDKIIVGISPYLEEDGLTVRKINNAIAFPVETGINGSKAENDRWRIGQVRQGIKQIAPNMPKIITAVQKSFLEREKNLQKEKYVTFDANYGASGL